MSNVAHLPIVADRYGACVRQIYLRGLDLTGVAMRAQVRLGGDVPGAPLVDLQTVANGNAEGLRLVSVTTAAGLPTSRVELVVNESTMEALPYMGEMGAATTLAWDWQITLAGRKQRVAAGAFVITGDGVTGADGAPTNRAAGWSTSSASGGMRTGATLSFGDDVIAVTVDGADLLAPEVNRAAIAAAAALASQSGAELAAGTALAASRYFVSRAAGQAASTVNQFFSTDDGAGNVIFYRRTAAGSTEIGRAVTPAMIAAPEGAGRVGWQAPFAEAAARTVEQKLGEGAVSLIDGRKAGMTDADALAKAATSGRIVHLPRGQGQGPGGSYVFETQFTPSIAAQSRIRLVGDGDTLIRMGQQTGTVGKNALLIDSGADDRMIDEVLIHGLTFQDDVATLGFSEFHYLLALNGVDLATIDACRFIGFRGDGIYVGTGLATGQKRKNRSILVSRCFLDGINTNNRNGLTIEQALVVAVRDSQFWRMTRRGGVGAFDPFDVNTGLSMPGAIDGEPKDFTSDWIRTLIVEGCLFDTIGGAAVRLWTSGSGAKDQPVGNYAVQHNDLRGCRIGVGVTSGGSSAGLPAADAASHNVTIHHNAVIGSEQHLLAEGIRGLSVTRNLFIAGWMPSDLGYQAGLRDLTYTDNFHLGDGQTGEYALQFSTLVGRSIVARNPFVGVGKTDGSGGAMALFRPGTVDGLRWEDNDAVAGGRTKSALVFLDGVNLNRFTCTDFGNSYDFVPATQNYRPYRTDNPVPLAVGGGFGSIRIDRENQVHFRLAGDSVVLPVTLPIGGTVGKHVITGAVGGAGAPLAAGEQNVPRVDARQSDTLTKISAQRWAEDGTETNLTGAVKLRVAGSYPAA